MNEITPNDEGRPAQPEQQVTLLESPNPEGPPLVTGIQALGGGPRLDVGPVPLTRVAHYELIKEVGRGGMGVVFKARDVRLNRVVALKMIRGGALANSDERQRFEKEASAAAQLQHPNIVALFEVSPHNEQPFLSMEFIGGTSLAERLALGPLSGRRAAEYLELTARAVHYAHTRGIVHRDLKPANILLDENDQPKVTDFGLAKQMETNSDQTRTGAILGTPSYMSPEQAAGRKEISPVSDVYSLGAILYELTTGKPPFCGETPLATLNLVAEQDPIAPRLLNPAVDRDLETICLKCLEKSPARRYASAESLADDLRRYIQGEPITARRVSVLARAVKWCSRNKAVAAMSFGFLLMMAGVLTFLSYVAYDENELRIQAEHDRTQAEQARRRLVVANDLAALRLETMRHLLYLSEMRQAKQTLRRADLDGVVRVLEDHWRPKPGVTDLRDWEWFFLKDQCDTRLAFGSHVGRAFAVAYRPDGRHLASAGGELNKPGEIRLREIRTGKILKIFQGHTNVITSLAFHPTKALLASASYDQTIKLWNLDTGLEVATLRGHTDTVDQVVFSPKGDRLASASRDLSVRVWDHAAFPNDPVASVRILAGHERPVTGVAFHPDGLLLASGSRDRAVKIWNLMTGQLDKTLLGHDGEIEAIAYSADGKTLVSGGGRSKQRGEVHIWEDDGKTHFQRDGLSDTIHSVAVSKDGKVAAAGMDGLVRIWNRARTSEAISFRADPQAVYDVTFAPDGLTLATAGHNGRVSLWNSSGGLETFSLSALGSVKAVAFNPKGSFLAAASPRGEVRVWNLEYPEQPIVSNYHKGVVNALAFSPDGNLLASGGEDQTVRVSQFRKPGLPPVALQGHSGAIHALAYRPDGALLASAGEDETIRLHDPANGKLVKELRGHALGILCLAFSPDGEWLASGSYDKTVRLWDLKTDGKRNAVLPAHSLVVNTVAFSPKGDFLASAGKDKIIRVWNVAERKEAYALQGTPSGVLSLAWHPRGRRIISVGEDRMIRLWDIVTKQEILEFEDHLGALRTLAISADGRFLAGGGTGIVRVWQASTEFLNAGQ
ncbi:MAG: serine/threonine protein kinase [Planctomycetes bacterium]|nr:serine/threonine protein kinase [Planctomycetota bacterium]